jgi:hypothetical protein
MKIMYCWRCGMDVPMFDETEFAYVDALYARAVRAIKEYSRTNGREALKNFILEQYQPVFEAHRRLTGRELRTDPAALLHHRIRKYGPPCSECGKPLRTPRATYCAACGATGPTRP